MKTSCQNIVSAGHSHNKNTFTMLSYSLLLLACLTSVSLQAATIQSPKSLRDNVAQFLNTHFAGDKSIRYSVGKLDPRLRLTPCKNRIEAYVPENQQLLGHTTVGLRCSSRKGWKIHVPVQIKQFKNVLVSNRNLPRGHQLLAADVTTKNMDVSQLNRGFYVNTGQLKGQVLTRSVLRGQQLNPGMLTKPKWVRRGQTITILAKTGQVAIRVKGKAMMDGRQGELVRVKNTSTNRELRGIVVAEGIVKVTL